MAKVMISLPQEFLKKVDRAAKAQGRSRSELIREALRTLLSEGHGNRRSWTEALAPLIVGTDTWVTSRWEIVADATRAVQRWLGQLPADLAEKIAWRNGDRLFPAP